MPPEGVDLRERLARKYGVSSASMFARVESAARESGIPLDFAKVTRSVNTIGAHTLLRHAIDRGSQRALAHALFDAYFLEGEDIGSPAVLADVAARHGFDAAAAHALAIDERERELTKREAMGMASQGISSVPFFVLDGRLALSGAQSVETVQRAIEKLLAEPKPVALYFPGRRNDPTASSWTSTSSCCRACSSR